MADQYQEHRYRAQDGLSLYYREYGKPINHQPSVLCLSGLARNSGDFDRLCPWLAERSFHVIAVDYRGRGKSDYCHDPMLYQPKVYLEDIRHLLCLLNLHDIIVVGTSLGGLLSMALGVTIPSTLKAVILNDVGPDINVKGLERIIGYLSQSPVFTSFDEAVSHFKEIFSQAGYTREDDWRWLTKNSIRQVAENRYSYNWDPNIVVPMKQGTSLPDMWSLYRSLKAIPVLAFRGEKSDILKEETFARMGEQHNMFTAVTVPGVGHVPSLNEPVSQEALNEFLSPFQR